MLAFEILFRVQHHPVLTFLGAVIVFRSLHVLPLGFSEWKSVHVWVWEVYIATALIVDHYYGYRVHGWNWLTSHTWADTCRCPQSQTPSERVRVRRETCDLFCLNKVWLLQMNSNCWYYRVIRVTCTESDLQTLSVSVTHTRAVTETLQIYTSTHKQTRMSRRHIHTPLLLRRFKTKRSCKMSSCLRCVNPVFNQSNKTIDDDDVRLSAASEDQRFQSRVWNFQSNLNILCYRFFFLLRIKSGSVSRP